MRFIKQNIIVINMDNQGDNRYQTVQKPAGFCSANWESPAAQAVKVIIIENYRNILKTGMLPDVIMMSCSSHHL